MGFILEEKVVDNCKDLFTHLSAVHHLNMASSYFLMLSGGLLQVLSITQFDYMKTVTDYVFIFFFKALHLLWHNSQVL